MIVASLSVDIKRYQDIICRDCREKVFRATLATAPSLAFDQPAFDAVAAASTSSASDSRQLSGTPSMDVKLSSIGQWSHISPPGHSDDTGSRNLTEPSPDSSRDPASVSRLSRTTRPPHSIDISKPASPSISEIATDPGPIPLSDWSAEFNPEITQSLRITLAKTFTLPSKVFSAKFSGDGKYLAVGLGNGETHIYDMTTGSKRSISLCGSPS